MVKLMVLYAPPADPVAFDGYYLGTHIPLAEKLPGLRRLEVTKLSSPDQNPPPYYLTTELYFDDAAALEAAMASPEGQATGADVVNFATSAMTMVVGEVVKAV